MFLCFQCFLCPIREALKKYIVLSWHKVWIDAFLWMLHFVTAPWLLFKGVSFCSGRVWFEASCGMGDSFGHHLSTYRLRWDMVPMTLYPESVSGGWVCMWGIPGIDSNPLLGQNGLTDLLMCLLTVCLIISRELDVWRGGSFSDFLKTTAV